MRTWLSLILFFVFTAQNFAQSPPGSDIYLVNLTPAATQIGAVQNISNHPGYDNQPAFLPDNSGLLYTAMRDSSQTDVFMFEMKNSKTTQLTRTTESEFSPTPLSIDPLILSTVRVEADGAQRLWSYNAAESEFSLLLPSIQPVGYHAWADSTKLALFVLGEPHELVTVDLVTKAPMKITSDIGRCLQKIPGETAVSFVQKTPEHAPRIKSVNLNTGTVTDIAPTLADGEDYVWFDETTLLMGLGAKIYRIKRQSNENWVEFLDLEPYGITSIMRLALSPDKNYLAFVADDAVVKKN
ncbi:PD40 domain-containing protein [candidate division KSB1 bacterium]|nr:PD40 domain-containing protein [candidate division KSB1 bacterium]